MRLLLIFLALFTVLSHARQTHSLDGLWKFHAFPGEGFDWRRSALQDGDVIIDNDDPNLVTISGKWEVPIEADRGTEQHGKDHLKRWFTEGEPEVNVRYQLPVKKSGHHEVFLFYPFGSHQTTRINIKHAHGLTSQHISQRNLCGLWRSIGVYNFTPDCNPSLEITATERPGGVVADAVMIRKLDDSALTKSRAELARAVTPEFDDTNWHDLRVPGHWGMINDYSNYRGKAWYRRTFDAPADWPQTQKKQVHLKFAGSYHSTRVFLNGEHLGTNHGGFTPFEFDITDKLNYGTKNQLAVEVDNTPIVGATFNWGGLIRSVTLVRTGDVRLENQYIHAEPDLTTGTATIELKVGLQSRAMALRKARIISEIHRDGQVIATLQGDTSVQSVARAEVNLNTTLTKDQVALWHFDDPNLYTLSTKVFVDETLVDEQSDRFGIRKIALTETSLVLNGEPIRLGGYNRVSDHRYWGSSEPSHILEKDLRLMKDAGCNFTRIMHGTQNKRLLELCDEIGIMVVEEINVRNMANPEFTAPDFPLIKQWLRGMVRRDRNHPSIIGWSIGNELLYHYGFVTTLKDYLKSELDPHRLVSCVSYTGYQKEYSAENDPLGLSDLIMQNCYQKTPQLMIEEITKKWPGRPLFFSEFGITRFDSASLDGDLPQLTAWYDVIRGKNTHVIGGSLWTFNDYRSPYAATLESENRTWGLVDVWRNKRRLLQRQQRNNSPVKDLLFAPIDPTSGTLNVTIPIRARDDFPSYTLHNHRLLLEFRDATGNIKASIEKDLPKLTPEQGEWKDQLTWQPKEIINKAFNARLSLLTKTGAIRYEKTHRFQLPKTPKITHIIPGDKTLRVLFNRTPDADEYLVRWNGGETKKTFDNHLDLEGLENDKPYDLELIAINQKGETPAAQKITATPNGKLLPPVIQNATFDDNKFILGYSGERGDQSYQVRYTTNGKEHTLTTQARGMLVINANKKITFQLRRTNNGKISTWTPKITLQR